MQLILPVRLYINENGNIIKVYKGWTENQCQGQGYLNNIILLYYHQITEDPLKKNKLTTSTQKLEGNKTGTTVLEAESKIISISKWITTYLLCIHTQYKGPFSRFRCWNMIYPFHQCNQIY